MRVTQRTMYNGFVHNMQASLGAYMESNIQASSQKKINRPSDDPAGMALILNTRKNMDNTAQLQRNVDTAEGWLNLADMTLTQVSTTISQIKTLAEQAATGTYSAENRLQISMQIRQMFGQLLNLANKQFEGKSIFAGHKYTEPAFGEVLAVNTMDNVTLQPDGITRGLQNVQFGVTGKSDRSIMLAFDGGGTIPPATVTIPPAGNTPFTWSDDGGTTWKTGTLLAGENQVTTTTGGVTLTIPNGTTLTGTTPPSPNGALDGSVLYIRPTAQYMGDVQGAEPYAVVRQGAGLPSAPAGMTMQVTGNFSNNVVLKVLNHSVDIWAVPNTMDYDIGNGLQTISLPNPPTGKLNIPLPNGGSIELTIPNNPSPNPLLQYTEIDIQPRRVDVMGGPTGLSVNAQGTFNTNVMVNIDDVTGGGVTKYSYSTDNGRTWIPASTQSNRLSVPGGYIELSGTPNIGTQFVIHPDRADLNYEIMKDTYVSVNSVGVNIFGGIYQGQPGLPGDQNLFEVVGKLIAYTENNNQTGVQQCLAALTTAQEKVLTEAARIGGLENRLTLAKDVLSFDKLDQQTRLSYTEDVNLTELLTRLAQQQLTYNTVLQSSSMIMQLNLAKFL